MMKVNCEKRKSMSSSARQARNPYVIDGATSRYVAVTQISKCFTLNPCGGVDLLALRKMALTTGSAR